MLLEARFLGQFGEIREHKDEIPISVVTACLPLTCTLVHAKTLFNLPKRVQHQFSVWHRFESLLHYVMFA